MPPTKRDAGPASGPTLRVLIVETPPDYTIDGTAVGELKVGGEYELARNIAEVLLALQVAVLPIGPSPTVQPSVPRRIH